MTYHHKFVMKLHCWVRKPLRVNGMCHVQPNRWVSEHVRLKKPHAENTQLLGSRPCYSALNHVINHVICHMTYSLRIYHVISHMIRITWLITWYLDLVIWDDKSSVVPTGPAWEYWTQFGIDATLQPDGDNFGLYQIYEMWYETIECNYLTQSFKDCFND
jgi:hypothetical protein